MANYTTAMTTAGLALLQDAANGGGTVTYTVIHSGDGALGAGDPSALTALISAKQTAQVADARQDQQGDWYIHFELSNAGVSTGYLRREMGVFGRLTGDTADTLIAYLYAASDVEADYVPAAGGQIATVTTGSLKITAATGTAVATSISPETVYLNLARWAEHLEGAGGADQHPAATSAAPGLMSAADKTLLSTLCTGYDARLQVGTYAFGDYNIAATNNRAVGFQPAPRGGVLATFSSECSSLANLLINVHVAEDETITWRFPRITYQLHIFVDGVQRTTTALSGLNASYSTTLTSTTASGVPHTIEFRHAFGMAGENRVNHLSIADWLSSNITAVPALSTYF